MLAAEKKAIENLALFFYFCFMDESRARLACQKALRPLREFLKNPSAEATWRVQLVKSTQKILAKQKNFGSVSHIGFVQGHIRFPEGSDWGPWFEFRKRTEPELFTAVIWVKVLGFKISEVAEGLGVTEGTVRFRLSRGLRELGAITSGGVPS